MCATKLMNAHRKFRVLSAGNEETASFLTGTLGLSDIEVVAVETMADAIRSAKCESYDAYILGMRFSDGNGVELCRALKLESPYIPVVFYTGDVFAADRAMGLKCGADAYLEKPYGGDIGSFILELIGEGRQLKAAYIYARLHRGVELQKRKSAQV